MSNETNVKIIIDERDNTRATAAPMDSTDIAFVPGFSNKTGAPENNPTLCRTIAEFTELFGDTPAELSDKVEGYSYDRGYIFARELLAAGMSVVYANLKTGTSIDVEAAFSESLETVLNLISDKSVYSVKYITNGGYATVKLADNGADIKLAQKLIAAAESRGDAVALIDTNCRDEAAILGDYTSIDTAFKSITNGSYGTMMFPWATYNCSSALEDMEVEKVEDYYVTMPASFAYLRCLASAIKTSPNFLAIAGVTRGLVPNIINLCTPNSILSNTLAEHMQPKFGSEGNQVSVNCITDVRPYGLTLWGNRTLKPLAVNKGTTALHSLNTRNMLSDIKKVLYTTAKSLMFEQNSDTLWLRFKSGVTPLLEQLRLGNGISDYRLIKTAAKTRGALAATIKIYPVSAVEYFELTVEINDQDVVVA